MPENIRNIIYRFSQELRRILGDKLTKIIVYGSYARGDFRENSDIDIMILVKMSDEEIRLVKTGKKSGDFCSSAKGRSG